MTSSPMPELLEFPFLGELSDGETAGVENWLRTEPAAAESLAAAERLLKLIDTAVSALAGPGRRVGRQHHGFTGCKRAPSGARCQFRWFRQLPFRFLRGACCSAMRLPPCSRGGHLGRLGVGRASNTAGGLPRRTPLGPPPGGL